MAEEILEEMEEGEGRGLYTILGVLLLLIVLVGAYLFFESRMFTDTVQTPEVDTEQVVGPTITLEYAIYAEANEGDPFVSVNAFMPEPGFAVVYDEVAGEPGNIIGYSRLLESGNNHEIQVNIESDVQRDQIIFVLLHKDDGDGQFSIVSDNVVVGAGGNLIMSTATVRAGEDVEIEEQTL